MRILLALMLVLLASPIAAQIGEVGLSWAPVTSLCSGNPATNIEYHVFWSLTPRPADTPPPDHYENTAMATLGEVVFTVPNLIDCTDYYMTVAAKSGTTWGGCSQDPGPHIDGYSAEVIGWARPRITVSDITVLERGKNYVLLIDGANFQDGVFTDATAEIMWGVPIVVNCNSIAVSVDIPIDATLGSVDVTFNRLFDTVLSVPAVGLLEVIDNLDAPPAPTNVRRTQP